MSKSQFPDGPETPPGPNDIFDSGKDDSNENKEQEPNFTEERDSLPESDAVKDFVQQYLEQTNASERLDTDLEKLFGVSNEPDMLIENDDLKITAEVKGSDEFTATDIQKEINSLLSVPSNLSEGTENSYQLDESRIANTNLKIAVIVTGLLILGGYSLYVNLLSTNVAILGALIGFGIISFTLSMWYYLND